MVQSLALDGIVIQTRRGRHVKALRGLDVVGFVDADEITCVLTGEGYTGSALCLIADNQVEVVKSLLLGFVNCRQ